MRRSRLTEETREMVIVLLQIGLSNKKIAVWTGVSHQTVRDYRRRTGTPITGRGILDREKVISLAIGSVARREKSAKGDGARQMIQEKIIQPFLDEIYEEIKQCAFLLAPQTSIEKLWWEAVDQPNIIRLIEDTYGEKAERGVYNAPAIRAAVRQRFRLGHALPCWQIREGVMEEALGTLLRKQRQVIKGLFGLEGDIKTRRAVAGDLGIAAERARQLKMEALGTIGWFISKHNLNKEKPFHDRSCWINVCETRKGGKKDEKTRKPEARKSGILSHHIEDINWSTRVHNCLIKSEIRTLNALVQRTEAELVSIPNFGRKSLEEVVEKLAQWGLKLKG